VVDFVFVIIKCFRYLLQLRRYKQKSMEFGVFWRGWVTLSANFRWKGALPTYQCWSQKVRGLHFGVVSKYLQCIVWFSHKACVWQTDRWTELWLPRPCC